MEGVISGIMYCNQVKDEVMNNRIAMRNVPSSPLQPYLDIRGVPTKYNHLQVVDREQPVSVPLKQEPVYNIAKTFNPGTAPAPWSGFAANIDVYSILRNQFFAIQACPQAAYIPGSSSDLYKSNLPNKGRLIKQHPLLGDKPERFRSHQCPQIPLPTFNASTRVERIHEI